MLKLKQDFLEINEIFEKELEIFVKNHWTSKVRTKRNNEFKDDPEIMLAIYWFKIKYIFTVDRKAYNKINKSYENYMNEKPLFNLFFNLSNNLNINFDFKNDIKI